MRQPIKFLPYFGETGTGGNNIARFKGLSVNCGSIGESWELSAEPGKQSIVAEGDYAGMELQTLVENLKGKLVGESVYSMYDGKFPINLKLVDSDCEFAVEVRHCDEKSRSPFRYYPCNDSVKYAGTHPLVSGPFFSVCRENVEGERILSKTGDRFMCLLCLEGEGMLGVDGISTPVKRGDTLLLPAPVEEYDVTGIISLLTIIPLI